MKHGDFTILAKNYINRPGYSIELLRAIAAYVKEKLAVDSLRVADVGAGTGKLTENLCEIGCKGYAVEPNEAMRCEGIKALADQPFEWRQGTAEATGLSDNSVDWVLMGSSFHWADASVAMGEFARILRPGGFFTAIWNPRDISSSAWHQSLEDKIKGMVPNLKRVSSGSAAHMQGIEDRILSDSRFSNLLFMEAPFSVVMETERYVGVWRSVNDIRVQAGEELFTEIMEMIENQVAGQDTITVPYKARAWTVQLK